MNTDFAPDFFVVGAPKAGSTAVFKWLKSHEEVFLPDLKEPGFFAYTNRLAAPKSGPYDPDYYDRITVSHDDYAQIYSTAKGRFMGDVSPVYLVDISVAARIAAVRPDARIIVLLRDPVDRAFSQYLHHLRDGLEPCSTFEAALKQETVRLKEGWSWGHGYATHSHYEAQIDAYLSAFPYDQILFLDFAHLQAEPGDSWRQICTHLNIQQKPLLQNEYVNVTATLTSVSDRPAIKRALRHPGRIQRLLKPLVPSHARKHLRKMLEGNGTPVPELQDTTRKALAQRFQLERISIEQQTGLSLGHWTRAS